MGTPKEGAEAPIHDYLPDVFKNHIDKGNGVFQVTQEIPYTINTWAVDMKDPRTFHGTLSVGTEVKLDGSTSRLKVNDNKDVENVCKLGAAAVLEGELDASGNRFRKTGIELVTYDISDISQHLTPLDYPIAFQKSKVKDRAADALNAE